MQFNFYFNACLTTLQQSLMGGPNYHPFLD
uniref:Uncharacterized protein n=1 Tax=Anguilla anguilla TaxID=7936 RepID=A0A0E9TTJ1_ANGAN